MPKVSDADSIFSLRPRWLGKEFIWISLGQGLMALGALVGVRLLTNVLTPASYGELALGMTLVTLTYNLVLWPISWAFSRFFAPAQEAAQLAAYLRGVYNLLTQGTVILMIALGVLSLGLWACGAARWSGLVLAVSPYALFSGYNFALDSIQNAARQRMIVAWHQGAGQWLRFLMAVALIVVLGASSQVALLGYALGSMLVLGSQIYFLRRRILSSISSWAAVSREDISRWTIQMRSYALPFVTVGVFTWALTASDRWALQTFVTTKGVGLYAVLYQLGFYPVSLISDAMVRFMSPVIFSQAGDGSDPSRVHRAHRLTYLLILGSVLLTLLGALLAFLFNAEIFELLAAPDYREVSTLLPWLVVSGGLLASGQAASVSLMTDTNTQRLIAPKISTALLGVLLNFAGAYWLGLHGVILAGLICSFVYFVWMVCLAGVPRAHLSKSNTSTLKPDPRSVGTSNLS